MKILSIIAQKPDYTGSGIYLRELIRCFDKKNIDQSIICGISKNDEIKSFDTKKYTGIYPVYFNVDNMQFDVVGMSDEMPYKSTKYIDLFSDEKKLANWINSFKEKIKEVYDNFKPDLIICHHLYLLTAITRDLLKDVKIYAICHNTGIRQYMKINKMREYIKKNIQKLDKIFTLTEENKTNAIEVYSLDESKVEIIGAGYNKKIFYEMGLEKNDSIIKLMYAGKISKVKGVLSLVKAFRILKEKSGYKNIVLDLVGGGGDEMEYNEISDLASKVGNINLIGKLTQIELAKEYNKHDIFILPSFNEGLPMVVIEAIACGMKVVTSNLPGIKTFINSYVDNVFIEYVELPKNLQVNNINYDELNDYEKRLADGILKIINTKKVRKTDINNLDWENVANSILK